MLSWLDSLLESKAFSVGADNQLAFGQSVLFKKSLFSWGKSHYYSPGVGGEGGWRPFWGITWFLVETERITRRQHSMKGNYKTLTDNQLPMWEESQEYPRTPWGGSGKSSDRAIKKSPVWSTLEGTKNPPKDVMWKTFKINISYFIWKNWTCKYT